MLRKGSSSVSYFRLIIVEFGTLAGKDSNCLADFYRSHEINSHNLLKLIEFKERCSLEPIVDLYNAFKDLMFFKAFLEWPSKTI